jgi:Fic-DOC domain mobile mystery protein B
MNDPLAPAGDGHTALSEEDRRGLIPTYIATRADLIEAEQRNVALGLANQAPTVAQLLDDQYLRGLHRRMFGDVWLWAGQYRTHETNLGVAPHQIAGAVRDLVSDVSVWIDSESYPPDEIAVRFHHRLVSIHPFPNGNGRHARVVADLLARAMGAEPFTWGRDPAITTEALRAAYRRALQRADAGDIDPLIAFARS